MELECINRTGPQSGWMDEVVVGGRKVMEDVGRGEGCTRIWAGKNSGGWLGDSPLLLFRGGGIEIF